MRAVIQRVSKSSVTVDNQVTGSIEKGILVLLGVAKGDTEPDAQYLVEKITGLRIFPDDGGKMNLDLSQAGGALLVVSQFTLLGDCRKGRRPGFDQAAAPDEAKRLYEYFIAQIKLRGLIVQTGIFQAHMEVEIHNDGPVTFIIDSSR